MESGRTRSWLCENPKRRPTSKTKITPKNKREEKAPTQIQIPSLGPKPDISCMKQIKQREGKESWMNAKLRKGFIDDDGLPQDGWSLGFLEGCHHLYLWNACKIERGGLLVPLVDCAILTHG